MTNKFIKNTENCKKKELYFYKFDVQFFVFTFFTASQIKQQPGFFYGKLGGYDVYIIDVEGPIDKLVLENIINTSVWTEEQTYRLIANFRRIGIDASIKVSGRKVFISLRGPLLIIEKKHNNDPLGLGTNMDKKFVSSKSNLYSSLRNEEENFLASIWTFLFSYTASTQKQVKLKIKTPGLFNSQISIEEEQVPIFCIIENFIDVHEEDRRLLSAIFDEIELQNPVKKENIFLKLFSQAFGDSGHYVQNMGKKEKETMLTLLKYHGYINAKFIKKTCFNQLGPDYKLIKAAVIYTLFLGKKAKLNRIIIEQNQLSKSVNESVQALLDQRLLNNQFAIKNIYQINKLLAQMNLRCIKTAFLNLSDQSFNLQIWIDYNDIKKFYQNIRFQNFPCPSETLYSFASHYGITFGASVIEPNLNKFVQELESISGRKINVDQKEKNGSMLTLTAGSTPKKFTFVENILTANPQEKIVLRLFQWQLYFVRRKLLKIILVPQLGSDLSSDLYKKIKVGGKLEVSYWTDQHININFMISAMLKVNETIGRILGPTDPIYSLESQLSIIKNDWTFFCHVEKTDSNILKALLKENSLPYLFTCSNLEHVCNLGLRYEHIFDESSDFSQNISATAQTFHPIKIRGNSAKAHGLNFLFNYTASYSCLNNCCLWKTICTFAPIKTKDSVFQLFGNYRIPGIRDTDIVGDAMFLNRLLITTEVWDSSTVAMKMFSLLVGIILQAGGIRTFKNYQNFISGGASWLIFGNIGGIILLDLMGALTFFISVTIDYRGNIIFDFGLILNSNYFAKDALISAMS